MEILLSSVAFLLVGLFMGYLWGSEKERSRIQDAFRLIEDYTYDKFYKVLEDYEALLGGIKAKERLKKQRKKRKN